MYSGFKKAIPVLLAKSKHVSKPLYFPECDLCFNIFYYFFVIFSELFEIGIFSFPPIPIIPKSSPVYPYSYEASTPNLSRFLCLANCVYASFFRMFRYFFPPRLRPGLSNGIGKGFLI